ncbi:hypothetical protein D3C79_1065060 [compost metagenome]
MFALYASGQRDNVNIKATRCLQTCNDCAHSFAAGDADRIAISDFFDQQTRGCFTYCLKCRLGVVRNSWNYDSALNSA